MSDIVGLTGLAGLEAEMRDRLKAKDAEIERLRALVPETGGKTEKEREAMEAAKRIVAWDEAHPKKRLSMVTRKAIIVARAYLALSSSSGE